MLKKKIGWKMAVAIAGSLLSFILFLSPVIVAAGVVSVPIVAINEIFTKIGDFLFDDGATNDAIKIITKYLDQEDTKKSIKEFYQPIIDKQEKSISLHWLLIPNLLAGIEEIDETLINTQIQAILTTNNNQESYINDLRKKEPWQTGFQNVSTTTIVAYINQFSSYLGKEESIDVGDLKEEEFLYPLKDRAMVTSEFGQRSPVVLPNGSVVDAPHTGTDLAYPGGDATTCGVPVYAAMQGEVVANERTQGQAGANWGSIRYKNLDVWYLHLRDPFPYEVGEKIKKGQFIGYIGSTGLSSGCHLHFETHVNNEPINARKFLDF